MGHIHIGSELCRPRLVICRTMAYMTYYLLTYLLSYLLTLTFLLTLWTRVLLETLTGFQLVKKFPAFY